MPEISVILPCLNMERYLEECLASVCQQTFSDIEILLVDAGSTDRTLEIAQAYQEKDARVKVVHSPRKSYGYQMNLGIEKAQGSYISIVETDDYIEKDMLASLYDAMSSGIDYVKGKGEAFYQLDEYCRLYEFCPCPWMGHEKMVTIVPRAYPFLFQMDCFLWTGLYRRELLRSVHFNETPGAAFQDIGALFQILHTARRGVYIDKIVYHYRQDNSGASSYNRKGLDFVRQEYEKLLELLPTLEPAWQHILYYKLANQATNRFEYMALGTYWDGCEDSCEWIRKTVTDGIAKGLICEAECSGWQLFAKDDRALYHYWQKKYQVALEAIDLLKQKMVGQQVYIFGCGIQGSRLADILKILDIKVAGFCDNDTKKQGKTWLDLPILSAEASQKEAPEAIYIIANRCHEAEIRRQLLDNKIAENRVYSYMRDWQPLADALRAYVQKHYA